MTVTDFRVCPQQPVTFPGAGKTFEDRTFGTLLIQVTDRSHGLQCVHGAWTWQSFNADESALVVACDWVLKIYGFDGRATSPLFAVTDAKGCPKLKGVSLQWDPYDPNVLYALEASRSTGPKVQHLWRLDISARQWTMVRDFAAVLPGHEIDADSLSMSEDGRTFTFLSTAPGGGIVACAWNSSDRSAGGMQLLGGDLTASAIHAIGLSRCGRWALITASNEDLAFWDMVTGRFIPYPSNDPLDIAWVQHLHMGRTGVIGGRKSDNAVVWRSWADVIARRPGFSLFPWEQPDGRPHWNGWHASILGADEKRFVLSSYATDKTVPGLYGDGELIIVGRDGFERIAHTRSTGKTYWAQPRGSSSRSGLYTIFSSDMGTPDQVQVFIAIVPDSLKRARDEAEQARAARDMLAGRNADLQVLVTARETERDAALSAINDLRARMIACIAALGVP